MQRERRECGCIPGEVACEAAAIEIAALRRAVYSGLADGDWSEFASRRQWLDGHLRGARAAPETELRHSA